jgi:hypothetical protein
MAAGPRGCPHWHQTDRVTEPKEFVMNRIHRLRRVAVALALTWLGLAVAAPAAFARIIPAPGGMGSVPASAGLATVPSSGAITVTRTVVVGGMPGWQIALIAAGAALLAAALAVLADRALAAHRKPALAAA